MTRYGGLGLFLQFVRRFKLARKLNENVHVLKKNLPYHESDHILTQAANLYVGGNCIEDLANLQNSEAVLRMMGACRLPDPTTGGDFLRRFDERNNRGSLEGLRRSIDQVQSEVWNSLGRRRKGRCKRQPAIIDVDGHIKKFFGVKKEGADFSYNGKWSHCVLTANLAGTGECLGLRHMPGNEKPKTQTAELLDEVLPRVNKHFSEVLVRGDSEFETKSIRDACLRGGASFAFVGNEVKNRPGIAESIEEKQWRPFVPRWKRQNNEKRKKAGFRKRRKKSNCRRRKARKRKYKELLLVRQWAAEVPYRYGRSEKIYRLIIRRQLIEHRKGQQFLFSEYRYRYVVTNLPHQYSTQEVIDHTYQRCDQENTIEQMKSGIAVWRLPVAEFAGNSAWLEIGRLAWNIGKWIAQLALPEEVVRWEWKRYRDAFVDVPAQVLKAGRQIWVRISASCRFHQTLFAAHQKLQL